MLVVRDHQLDVLRQALLLRFENTVVQSLTAEYPQKIPAMGEPAVRELIRKGLAFANAYGIVSEGGVIAVIGLIVQFGEGFEYSPDRAWAMKVLSHPTAPGPLKVELLVTRMAGRAEGRVVRHFAPRGNE